MADPTRPNNPFRSARLVYRAVRDDDISLFTAINDDYVGFINSNAGNIRLPSRAQAESFRKQVAEQKLLGAVICLSAEDSDKAGTPIGQIALDSLPSHMIHHRNTEIGVDILPEYQRNGYGSEAINWVLDYAFRRAGLHKVRIRAFEWNTGAIKLYERLGFQHEGRDREALWNEGRFWDSIEMGMLDREWFEMQKKSQK